MDDTFASIRSSGGVILKEPAHTTWGGYSGYFTDPEGHLWEVAYNPQFKYDDDGTMIIPQ